MSDFSKTVMIAGILLLSVFVAPGWADPIPAPTLSVVPVSGSSVGVGNQIQYDINISNVSDLYAFQFDVIFNPKVVSFVSIDEGPFLPSGGATFFIPGTLDSFGSNTLAATGDVILSAVPGVTGDGILAILTLQGVGGGISSLDLANVLLLDSNLSSIDSTLQSGSVTVTSTAVPEPSSALLLLAGVSSLFLVALLKRS
jgi:hypothetical protein